MQRCDPRPGCCREKQRHSPNWERCAGLPRCSLPKPSVDVYEYVHRRCHLLRPRPLRLLPPGPGSPFSAQGHQKKSITGYDDAHSAPAPFRPDSAFQAGSRSVVSGLPRGVSILWRCFFCRRGVEPTVGLGGGIPAEQQTTCEEDLVPAGLLSHKEEGGWGGQARPGSRAAVHPRTEHGVPGTEYCSGTQILIVQYSTVLRLQRRAPYRTGPAPGPDPPHPHPCAVAASTPICLVTVS